MSTIDQIEHQPSLASSEETSSQSPIGSTNYSRRQMLEIFGSSIFGLVVSSLPINALARPDKPQEYKEWASEIKLPTVEFSEGNDIWTSEKIGSHLIPKGVDQKELEAFYAKFDLLKKELRTILSRPQTYNERFFLILQLKDWLTKSCEALTKTDPGEDDYWVETVNRFIIPCGHYISPILNGDDKKPNIALHQLGDVYDMTVKMGSKQANFPVFSTASSIPIYLTPDFVSPIGGKFVPEDNYAFIDKEKIESSSVTETRDANRFCEKRGLPRREVSADDMKKDSLNMMIIHEGMHAALFHLMGIETGPGGDIIKRGGIRKRGTISMGSYQFPEKHYRWENNVELHELAAYGFGLMHSGKMGAIDINGALFLNSKYKRLYLLKRVLMREIAYSPHIPNDVKSRLMKGFNSASRNVRMEDLQIALIQIPDEGMREIGERIVKLAIYLTQGD